MSKLDFDVHGHYFLEKCFYGPWNEFGPCQNGVKTKTRPIVSGGDKCQRKAAKVRPCTQ